MNIQELMSDGDLFGKQFGGESWAAWRALLAGFYGLELTDTQMKTFTALTGLSDAPEREQGELWQAIGRRGGKSHIAALLAVYEAFFRDHADQLSPGEVATVFVVAADRRQSRVVMRYIEGLIDGNDMLRQMVVRRTSESIELRNRCHIEVGTCSIRALRGYTLAAAILDEIAFWLADGARPDTEVVNSIRPALATLNGKMFALSSPYARRGALWQMYRRHYGKPGRVLVAQAPSRTMNPNIPEHVVEEALAEDPEAARAEYLAEFRSDVETFIDRQVVEDAARREPLELGRDETGRTHYRAFVDPSGGGADGFTICIGHRDGDRIVVDALRERKGAPAGIVDEYSRLLKDYGLSRVHGDRYAGSWPSQEFERHLITYVPCRKSKSDLYIDSLAAFNNARVEIPPDPKLIAQFAGLERRTSRGGRDSIDHAPQGHDDKCNAVAGLIHTINNERRNVSKTSVAIGAY